MAEEGFLQRWSRLKTNPEEEAEPLAAPPVVVEESVPVVEQQPERPTPTLEDVARLTRDSDYSAFMAKGVDKTVQRMALKKLFADPHFNVMDGLDIYISDYNKVVPLAPDMLAALRHAPGVLDRLFADEREAEENQASEQGNDQPEKGTA